MRLILRDIVENIDFEELSNNWRGFDFESFSKSKKLYDFQKKALENILKLLWFYYEKYFDFKKDEDLSINNKRKEKLFREYLYYRLSENEVDHPYKEEAKHKFIFDYFPLENQKISFKHFINRAGFWMATGSGKTLIIVKLIEILKGLIKREEIPDYDILFLTYRDDLIDQFKKHIQEYNQSNKNKILLHDLKEYEKIKRNYLFKENFVFYYRSDLLSDEQKEKILDFKNYYNDGKWYIILDEAHKGDKEDSKRQHIFSILSKNGFLFNFSATFDDIRDLITTCFEYNLYTFIKNGYGKKIYISEYEAKAFKDELNEKGELNEKDKLKVILKAAILFTYIKKNLEKIRKVNNSLYHNPLMMVLVNSVNSEIADLKIFFEHLRKIANCEFDKNLINESKEELKKDFKEKENLDIPDDEKLNIDFKEIDNITYDDILFYVFNSKSCGDIEVSFNPSIKGEVVFKLKTSDVHFALMKTGDMPKWLKEALNEFPVNHTFEEEKFFEKINSEDSKINILLGSRAFYEGWDSNRPNIILFINIGVGKEAKKFILQSIGRGVRIEPIKNHRKRALYIKNKIGEYIFDKIKNNIDPIETIFIFGTNKEVIVKIISEVEEFTKQSLKWKQVSLFKNEERIKDNVLLIPKYQESIKSVFEQEEIRYEISEKDFNSLKEFNQFLTDDRILVINYDVEPKLIKFFRDSLLKQVNFKDQIYYKESEIERGNIFNVLDSLFKFWGQKFQEFKEFSELKDEIIHFERVSIEQAKIQDFNKILQAVKQTKISLPFENLDLKYISEHYYLPLIVSKDEKIDYIKHIIKTKSELEFIEKLEKYLNDDNNKLKSFDWWMFSKIDESLDEVYIPYYDYEDNSLKKFKPDFIFWLRKGNDYFIVFVDPKSYKFTSYENKIYWYKKIFEENNKPKKFKYKNIDCYVYCYLNTNDVDKVKSHSYRDYWFDNFDGVFSKILNNKI